jgi:peptidoglycan lytic transglycosylase F
MNFMKINHWFVSSAHLRVLLFAFLFPVTTLASELDSKATDQKFCDAPVQQDANVEALDVLLEDDDFDAIKERGTFRVLLQKQANECVISLTERQLLEEFAYLNDLNLQWIYVDNNWELLPELIKGNGDIIVAQDQSLSASIQDQVDFTHVWANARFKIVERADNSHINRSEDFAGRQVAAYKASPVWHKLLDLEKTQVGMVLQEIPADVTYDEVMQRVKTAQYDLAVADSLFLDKYLPSNSELQANFNLSDQRSMAWVVRSNAEDLHKTLNQYLNQQHLTHDIASVYFEDLPSIKDKGVLRVITYATPSHYYLHNGKLFGFEYELLSRFATQYRLRLDVVLANTQEEMFELLKQGKGDVIAASLPSSLIKENKLIQYTAAYNYASPVLVGRGNDVPVIDLSELAGRSITLSQDSPYWDYMLQLKDQGLDFELLKADEGIDLEGTALMVTLGMYDLTVVGNHQLTAGKSGMAGLKSQFILSEPQAHRWAVRADDQQLFDSLNNFIEKDFRSEKYNVLHAKYFEQPKIKKIVKSSLTQFTSLSPYDEMTQHYSAEYGFDWRLITALMFQESQFNPEANSYAGAQGLMQLIPATADFMGVSDTNNPESSIDAGVRYLDYLRTKFENTLLLEDRIWFTLASYNAGYGRVKRARELTEKMGLDKDQWFDNVEIAMMALAKPYYKDGEQVRYCRCGQTVVYVREIRTRYFNYIRLVETQKVAMVMPPSGLTYSARLN